MNERAEVEELGALLRSKVPLILVETHEEPRVLKLLSQACNLEQQVLLRWSIVDGIARVTGAAGGVDRSDAGYTQTNDLVDALKHIDKSPQNGVYALCDAHPGLKDPVCVRLIREIALEHYRCARTLVFVSPRLEDMPSELLRLASHFRPALPTRDDIRAIISEEADLWHSQTGEKARGDRASVDQLVMHLTGLEFDDVRRLVRQALRGDGEINGHDIRRVLATKHAALGGAGVLGFEHSRTRFDDVGGLARLKHWIGLRRAPFLDADGVDTPKGVLLLGVMGGGKSLSARAIAGEWGVPLMRLDFGAIYNKFYGESERNLRQALAAAEGMSPCVLWIDELEKGIATGGGGDSGDGDGVSRRVLGTLLTWLAERSKPVFIVATANDIAALPPELIRKGRFDEIFFVDFPQGPAREQIFSIHLTKRRLDPAQFDLAGLAHLADGYSGAELEQAIVAANFEARARQAIVATDDVRRELERTRPLSVVMAEKVHALRAWAHDRAVLADDPENPGGR